jgi:hypothetical protein
MHHSERMRRDMRRSNKVSKSLTAAVGVMPAGLRAERPGVHGSAGLLDGDTGNQEYCFIGHHGRGGSGEV